MGMVGGGEGAFIGQIHRIAAAMDGNIELVCGAFSSDPEISIESGRSLFLDPERCYPDYQTMIQQEAQLPSEVRMDFVCIVTPNNLHFSVAQMALEHCFHVLSDKPATFNLLEATTLKSIQQKSGRLYGLTHTYTGYPLVKQAKQMVIDGALGNIRKIVVEYVQGWLSLQSDEDNKQAGWRLDSSQSGASCCMGDIGVHAFNLAEYISGDKVIELCADLNSVVEGRELDDDGTVLLRYASGAKGILIASQIAIGEENDLRIRIYGDKASLDWSQMEPNSLKFKPHGKPIELIRAGQVYLSEVANNASRTPAGHPEGYLEAFANIYQNFSDQILAFETGNDASNELFDVPGIEEAVRGMAFIENAVKASKQDTKWHSYNLESNE